MTKKLKKVFEGLSRKKNDFSAEDIKSIVNEMVDKGVTEITLRERGRSLTLKRPQASQDDDGQVKAGGGTTGKHVEGEEYKAIYAPAVGVIHLSQSSGSTHFVSEGQMIEPGQVVALIETLKVMSEVKADTHGRVVSIEVKNGDMVEFGQPIILFEEID